MRIELIVPGDVGSDAQPVRIRKGFRHGTGLAEVERHIAKSSPAVHAPQKDQSLVKHLRNANKREVTLYIRLGPLEHLGAALPKPRFHVAGDTPELPVVALKGEAAGDKISESHLPGDESAVETVAGPLEDVVVGGDEALAGVTEERDVVRRLGKGEMDPVEEVTSDEA